MIVRWPDAGAAGQRVPALVSLVDIMPTILAAAKVPCPDGVDGKSLRGLLAGEASRWRDELVVECGAVNALLTPQWKYIRWKDGFEELYDRVSDPHDLSNVSRDPSLAPTREDLARRLASWRA
jgi:arylsulfatase A-like enzyme